jgi:hypothetical protein
MLLYNIPFSLALEILTKSRRIMGHVKHMGEAEMRTEFLSENLKEGTTRKN